jgi:hypothetical protein
MQQLAQEVGISDVALAKNCRKYGIPIPPRGYWAKLQAGKPVYHPPLPPRELGESTHIEIAGNIAVLVSQRFGDDVPMQDGPYEDIAVMAQRFRKRLGKVTVPRDFSRAHRIVRKYLDKDETHRQKKLTERFYWHNPAFDTPFEVRRLRILNALFVASARVGGKCWAHGESAQDFGITIGDWPL